MEISCGDAFESRIVRQEAHDLLVVDYAPLFIANITASLQPYRVLVVGTPSLESRAYAFPASKAGHINGESGGALKFMVEWYFHHWPITLDEERSCTHQIPLDALLFLNFYSYRKEIGGI